MNPTKKFTMQATPESVIEALNFVENQRIEKSTTYLNMFILTTQKVS